MWNSATDLSSENARLVGEVFQLEERGLLGMQILRTWIERNIQPLAWWEHLMYMYKGLRDPASLHNREISPSELRSHIHFVIGVPRDDIFLEVTIEPYHRGNPPPEVNSAFPPFSACSPF